MFSNTNSREMHFITAKVQSKKIHKFQHDIIKEDSIPQ